ncbi:MAG: hypothetical protein ACP5I8_08465 [Phycisphaerae bacterium]
MVNLPKIFLKNCNSLALAHNNQWPNRTFRVIVGWFNTLDSQEGEQFVMIFLHDPLPQGIGTKVFGKGPSRLAGSVFPSWRSCGHEKETADKTQNLLILQRIIALQTSEFCRNIRYHDLYHFSISRHWIQTPQK